MLKMICGTKQKCLDWINNISSDADYSEYWDPTDLTITKDIKNGEILGTFADDTAFSLWGIPQRKPNVQKFWLVFIVDASFDTHWTINNIIYAGIITATPATFITDDASVLRIRTSNFKYEFTRLTVKQPAFINQYADVIIKKIINSHVDRYIVNIGDIQRPVTKPKVVKFGTSRTVFSALTALAELYPDYRLKITPSFNVTFAGCIVSFEKNIKNYAPLLVNDDLIRALGPDNTVIDDDISQQKNIFTLPFYQDVNRPPDIFTQVNTAEDSLLNSKCVLSAQPANINTINIYVDDFSTPDSTDLLENDLNNNNPPEGHIASEGYLVRGNINEVIGLHILDASDKNPNWGEVSLINNYETVLFECQNLTSLRIKELTISTLGDGIFCSYYDNTTKSSTITSVDSYTVFDVEDASSFAVGDIVKIDNETANITNIQTNKIYISRSINIIQVGKECYLSDFNLSRVIFGLYLKADASINIIQNGQISSTAYNYQTEDYTVRNHCICNETFTSGSTTDSDTFEVNSSSGFLPNDIIELWENGNNNTPIEYKIISIPDSTHIQINQNVTVLSKIKVRTMPKAKLQINGGTFGEVSGPNWQTIATMANTIQTEINQPRDIGFAPVIQKSIVGTIKEVNVKHYPDIEVISNNNLLTISTVDDSAEMDVHGFLINENNKYRIEFPEYQTVWPSSTLLVVKYKEKRVRKITDKNERSIVNIARDRGNPILPNDQSNWDLKGGVVAPTEELVQVSMSIPEARTLLNEIKKIREIESLQITLDNLVSSLNYSPAQTVKVNLESYGNYELIITRIEQKLLGNSDSGLVWVYRLQMGIIDNISQLIQKANKSNLYILDQDSEGTLEEVLQHSQTEDQIITEEVKVIGGISNAFIYSNGIIADIRVLSTGGLSL